MVILLIQMDFNLTQTFPDVYNINKQVLWEDINASKRYAISDPS